MIKISPRLHSLVKYIFKEDSVMDVGCDHALLDIYLVQNGYADQIYVCDVNPNALQNAINNIERYELSANIFPVLGFGIEKIGEFGIDTLVISGMGAKNIIEILSSPNLERIGKLILQSNNNHSELRKFLTQKGFNIVDEEVIPDGKKTYINIIAIRDYAVKTYSIKEYEFGPILSHDKRNLEYFKKLYENYENILIASKSDEVREKLKYLEEIIEELK